MNIKRTEESWIPKRDQFSLVSFDIRHIGCKVNSHLCTKVIIPYLLHLSFTKLREIAAAASVLMKLYDGPVFDFLPFPPTAEMQIISCYAMHVWWLMKFKRSTLLFCPRWNRFDRKKIIIIYDFIRNVCFVMCFFSFFPLWRPLSSRFAMYINENYIRSRMLSSKCKTCRINGANYVL